MKLMKKAFTLVELLVVIAILGILATVGIVSYTAITKKANTRNAADELSQIKKYLVSVDPVTEGYEIIPDEGMTFSGKSTIYCTPSAGVTYADAAAFGLAIAANDLYTKTGNTTNDSLKAHYTKVGADGYVNATTNYYTLTMNDYGWDDVVALLKESKDISSDILENIGARNTDPSGRIIKITYNYNDTEQGAIWNLKTNEVEGF